jgi:TP901 family phage tail tape measure protein
VALNNLGLGFVFTARDLASGTINRVGGAFGHMDRNALRASQAYQRNFAVMGTGLAIMGAGAATLAGAFSLAGAAGDFELQLARVGGIARANAEQMGQLRQAAIDAGIATQFSPVETIEGLGALAQQGFNTQQSISLLTPVLDLAAGGMISVEHAAQSVTAAVHVFGLSMDQATIVADQMLRITNSTALAAGDMELAIGTVARGARLTHQSIEEMLPSVGLLRNTGVDVSVAAQSVSSALTFMASRSEEIQQQLGVNLVETLADGTQRFRPFMEIAMEAGTALEERFADPAERTAVAVELFSRFGVGAVTGVFEALKTGVTDSEGRVYRGAEAIEYLRGQITGAAGAAEEFRNRLLNTFEGQRTLLQGALQTLGVVLGEGFTRGLRPFIEGTLGLVTKLVEFLNGIPVEVRGALASAVIAAGVLLSVFGAIVAAGASLALLAPFLEAIVVGVLSVMAAMAPFAVAAATLYGFGVAIAEVIRQHTFLGMAIARTWNGAKLAFRALVQLFTTGELSGAVAREMTEAGNAGLLSFVIDLYAIGFRVVQFFRGIRIGFSAAIATMGPSVERLVMAFSRLGAALGLTATEGADAVASMPSESFMARGALLGEYLATAFELVLNLLTGAAIMATAAWEGFGDGLETLEPVWAAAGMLFEALGQQLDGLLTALGVSSGLTGESRSSWETFAYVLSFLVAGAIGVVTVAIEGIGLVILGVITGIRLLVEGFNWLRVNGALAAIGLEMVFYDAIDGILNQFDRMIIGFAELVNMVPESLRPDSLSTESNNLAAQTASGRITARGAEARTRTRRLQDEFDAQSVQTSAIEAQATGARSDRQAAALDGVAATIARQAEERARTPLEVSLQVDGEVLARATTSAQRRDGAAGFAPVSSEE